MVDWSRRTYRGRSAFLATMHYKERVIAPTLRNGVGLHVTPSSALDTDQFGTFSGERPRTGSAIEAARAKITAGLSQSPCAAIGLASEGSFGPDPNVPLVPIGREIVLFFDSETGLEVIGTATDHEPCFHHACVSNTQDAAAFADRVGFPEHGIIVCSCLEGNPDPDGLIFKESDDLESLQKSVVSVLKESQSAFLQTDMRANRNPTRMKAIGAATRDLVCRLQCRCPSCNCPGFYITEWRPGRTCNWCGLPTRIVELEILTCQNCGHREERRAAGPDRVDPALCDYCNP